MADINEQVIGILDEVQKSSSAIRAAIRKLQVVFDERSDKEDQEQMLVTLFKCFDQLLVCSKKEAAAERVLKFFSSFIASSGDELFRTGMEYLLFRSQANDKTVRFRSLQTIAAIFSAMPEGAEIAQDLWDKMSEVLLPRLKDKQPNVRLWALRATSRIQTHDEKDPFHREFCRLMTTDASKDIRVTAIETIHLTNKSLPALIERIKDVRPEVKVAAYDRLEKNTTVKHLKAHMRLQVVQHGLRDRDETVRKAAVKLIFKWLSDVEYNVPKLLHLINMAENEEEAEIVGLTIIDEIEKTSILPVSMKKRIQDHVPSWDDGLDALPPGEILFAYLRCLHAQRTLSGAVTEDILEQVIPDIVRLCQLLKQAHKVVPPTGFGTGHTVLQIRYLLRLTNFVDSSDISGSQEIENICKLMLRDIRLNDILVEPVLNAWFKGIQNDSFGKLLLENIECVTSTMEGDTEEDDMLKQVRALQMISWMLSKYSNGNTDLHNGCVEFVEQVSPIISAAMATPFVELRELAVRCLGLSSLAHEPALEMNQEIIRQVVQNDIEEDIVRGQGLQAIFDIAIVYADKFKNDIGLTNMLLRVLESGNTFLVSVASEGCAKLLFSGAINEPRVFAQLLKLFLIMDQSTDEISEDDTSCYVDSGSRTYMQQILSVFFHAFFIAGNGRETTALQSIGDLIADLSSMIKFGDLAGSNLIKVVSQFLSLCDSVPDKMLQEKVRSSFFAAISREVLKTGSSKAEQASLKDFIKALSLVNPDKWVSSPLIPIVNSIVGYLFKIVHDKASLKILEKLAEECEQYEEDEICSEEAVKCVADFYATAPGLADLMDISSCGTDNEVTDLSTKLGGSLALSSAFQSSQPAQTKDDGLTKSVRPVRSSKFEAQKKISDQLMKENMTVN